MRIMRTRCVPYAFHAYHMRARCIPDAYQMLSTCVSCAPDAYQMCTRFVILYACFGEATSFQPPCASRPVPRPVPPFTLTPLHRLIHHPVRRHSGTTSPRLHRGWQRAGRRSHFIPAPVRQPTRPGLPVRVGRARGPADPSTDPFPRAPP